MPSKLEIRLPNVPRPNQKICIIGDAAHNDEAEAKSIPHMSADDLKKLNKDKVWKITELINSKNLCENLKNSYKEIFIILTWFLKSNLNFRNLSKSSPRSTMLSLLPSLSSSRFPVFSDPVLTKPVSSPPCWLTLTIWKARSMISDLPWSSRWRRWVIFWLWMNWNWDMNLGLY